MKRYPILLGLFIIAFIGLWILGQKSETKRAYPVEGGQLVFRMADYRSSSYPSNEGIEEFVRLVEEGSNGEIKILIYDENVLGNETDIVEQVAFGGIDFARVSSLYMIDYVPMMETVLFPGMFQNEEEMMKIFNDDQINTMLKTAYKNEKINVLAWYPGSKRGIFHRQGDINEIVGEKIGVPECQMKINEIEGMGFMPVPAMSYSINSYLKSNYIEGAEGDLMDYYYNKNYLKAPHFTVTYWSMIPEAIIVSNTAIKKLTMEQQDIIQDAANEAALYITELTKEKEAEIEENLLNSGVEFHMGTELFLDEDIPAYQQTELEDNSELVNLINEVLSRRRAYE